MTSPLLGALVLATVAQVGASGSPSDQPPGPVGLDPDTVRVGEHLTVTAGLDVPPGHTLYFPDTLAATTYVETRRPARWEVRERRGDTARVAVSWTLAVYRPGPTPLPPVPVVMRERAPAPGTPRTELPGGGWVGAWAALPRVPDFTYVRSLLETGEVYVAPTILEFDLMEGALPRGPADVAGRSWNAAATALAATSLLGLMLLGAGVLRDRRGRERAPPPPPPPARPAWALALRELDRVRALELHRRGRVDEFYARSTDAVRRYVESLAGGWGPSLTTTELVERAERELPAPRLEPLRRVLDAAEVVKFGRRRPGVDDAEGDWAALREWVETTGRGNGGPPAGGARP